MYKLMNEKNSKLGIAVFMFAFMALFALCSAMLGTLLPQLIKGYSLKLSHAGLITFFQSFGGILSLIFGGIIADRVRKLNLIASIFFIYSITLLLIGLVPVYIIFLLLFFILGICSSMLNMVITAYLADLFPEKRSFYVNLAHTFFGLGSVVGPIYTIAMTDKGFSWNKDFLYQGFLNLFVVAALVISLFVLFKKSDSKEKIKKEVKAPVRYLDIISDKRIISLCVISFIFMGYQASISTWLPTYLTDHLNYGNSFMGLVMSLFWMGMVAGRISLAFISLRINDRIYIAIACIGGSIVLLSAILLNIPAVWILAAAILGILTGPVFPLLLVLACELYPQKSATASSVICLCTTFASMLFPLLIGTIAESISFKTAILLPVINLAIVTIIIKAADLKSKLQNVVKV
jgi:fucose permease